MTDTSRPGLLQADVGTGRDVGIDAARLLGVAAIVAGHTWPAGWVGDAVFPWHVPLFFMLTGYLWHDRPWHRELAVRVQTLLRPYVSWLVVMGALMLVVRGVRDGFDTAQRELLPALAWGGQRLVQPFSAHWFITCLFFCCVLYAAVDRGGPWLRGTAVLVGAALTVAGAPQLAELPLAAGTALPAIVLIEAGRQLHRAERWLDGTVAWVAAGLVLVLAAVAVATGRLPRLDLKVGDFGQPVLGVTFALAISVALLVLAHSVPAPRRAHGPGGHLRGHRRRARRPVAPAGPRGAGEWGLDIAGLRRRTAGAVGDRAGGRAHPPVRLDARTLTGRGPPTGRAPRPGPAGRGRRAGRRAGAGGGAPRRTPGGSCA